MARSGRWRLPEGVGGALWAGAYGAPSHGRLDWRLGWAVFLQVVWRFPRQGQDRRPRGGATLSLRLDGHGAAASASSAGPTPRSTK